MSVSMTILAITVQLIKSSGILRSKAMRMAEKGRLATAPDITIHLPSSICPLGIGEFPRIQNSSEKGAETESNQAPTVDHSPLLLHEIYHIRLRMLTCL
jgi:hypothetical protein